MSASAARNISAEAASSTGGAPATPGTGLDVPLSVPPHAPSVLIVDLAALKTNYRALCAIANGAECASVVKADGYGLGLEPVASALAQEGCRTFFVATLDEAFRLRKCQPGADIYVLDGLFPASAAGFADLGARPVLGSLEEVREWAAFCASAGRRLPAALHIDTGLHRLGLPPADVEALAREPQVLAAFDLTLVLTHLACADVPGHPANAAQRDAFEQLRALLPPTRASLANSAATLLGQGFHLDLIRPGIALYGGAALSAVPNPMKPVVRLLARIAQVRHLPAGAPVGYGATFVTARPTRLATVAAGYADGLPRLLSVASGSSGLNAMVRGQPAPIVGRLSMDLLTLDVTDIAPELTSRGAFVELIGPHMSVDAIAERCGTIGYEILTKLGRRCHRVYVGG